MTAPMKTIGAFFLWWIIAHISYSFIMLEWTLFTDWGPVARASNLAASVYVAAIVYLRVRNVE